MHILFHKQAKYEKRFKNSKKPYLSSLDVHNHVGFMFQCEGERLSYLLSGDTKKACLKSSNDSDEKTAFLPFKEQGTKEADVDYWMVTFPMDTPTKSKGNNLLGITHNKVIIKVISPEG